MASTWGIGQPETLVVMQLVAEQNQRTAAVASPCAPATRELTTNLSKRSVTRFVDEPTDLASGIPTEHPVRAGPSGN